MPDNRSLQKLSPFDLCRLCQVNEPTILQDVRWRVVLCDIVTLISNNGFCCFVLLHCSSCGRATTTPFNNNSSSHKDDEGDGVCGDGWPASKVLWRLSRSSWSWSSRRLSREISLRCWLVGIAIGMCVTYPADCLQNASPPVIFADQCNTSSLRRPARTLCS